MSFKKVLAFPGVRNTKDSREWCRVSGVFLLRFHVGWSHGYSTVIMLKILWFVHYRLAVQTLSDQIPPWVILVLFVSCCYSPQKFCNSIHLDSSYHVIPSMLFYLTVWWNLIRKKGSLECKSCKAMAMWCDSYRSVARQTTAMLLDAIITLNSQQREGERERETESASI